MRDFFHSKAVEYACKLDYFTKNMGRSHKREMRGMDNTWLLGYNSPVSHAVHNHVKKNSITNSRARTVSHGICQAWSSGLQNQVSRSNH